MGKDLKMNDVNIELKRVYVHIYFPRSPKFKQFDFCTSHMLYLTKCYYVKCYWICLTVHFQILKISNGQSCMLASLQVKLLQF